MLVMFIVFMLGTFGLNFQLTNALMATAVFHVGAEQYGLLGSMLAIGSLSAGLLAARRTQLRLRLIIGAHGGFLAGRSPCSRSPPTTGGTRPSSSRWA